LFTALPKEPNTAKSFHSPLISSQKIGQTKTGKVSKKKYDLNRLLR